MPGAGALLGLGAGSAVRRPALLAPLVAAEVIAYLLGWVPVLVLAGRVLAVASRSEASDPTLALLEGVVALAADPGPWVVAGVGAGLAAAGGWLVRTTVQAGCARSLASALAGSSAPERGLFSASLLRAPARWLAAGAIAGLLRLLVLACALGAVVAGMVFFKARPGAPAALAMTIATGMAVLLPYLDAALEIGFVRAVLVDEPPHASLGEGVLLAFRRAGAVLPSWFLLVLADGTVALGLNTALFAAGSVPAGAWALVPQAIAWLAAATATALVALVRLGTWAAAIAADAGLLPSEPPPPAPAAPEPVLEAVPVEPEPILEATPIEPEPVADATPIEPEPVADATPAEPGPAPEHPPKPGGDGEEKP